MGDAYRLFDEKIRDVYEDRRSGVVTLSVTWRDSEQASEWANALIARANRQLRERTIVEAKQVIGFLNDEVARTQVVEVQKAIYKLVEEQIKSIAVASAREQYSFRVIDPAVAPDVHRPVRPRRVLAAAIAVLLGGSLSALTLWIRDYLRRRAVPSASTLA